MADFGIGETAAAAAAAGTAGAAGAGTAAAGGLTLAQAAALASLAATTLGIGTSIYDRANQPGVQGVPKPPPFSTTTPTTPTGTTLPPGERYNKPPVAPGNTQPFLANLVPDQTGDSNLDVLADIRRGMTA